MIMKKYYVSGIIITLLLSIYPLSYNDTEGSQYNYMSIDLSNSYASFIGEDADDWSGREVAIIKDVNGDGLDDILIGASGDEEGGSKAGQVYLIFGSEKSLINDLDLSIADASFIGESADDYAGCSVSSAGDVNGDGFNDIIIGAYGNEDGGSTAGQAYLIFGKYSGWAMDTDLSTADASFIGEDADDQAGCSVSGVGDVNNDGYDDVLIGAYGDDDGGSNAGQSYLIFGMASGWTMDRDLSTANASFWGEDTDDWSGYSVNDAGDVNNDGYDDILIGTYLSQGGRGQTYLIFGKETGWSMDTDLSLSDSSFVGSSTPEHSSWSISGAGDVNGDGYDDILIGSPNKNDGGGPISGRACLFFGKETGWAMDISLTYADSSFFGEEAGDRAGRSVSCAGDVNNDGYDDILIGASYNDDGGTESGEIYLFLGKPSGWERDTDMLNADAFFIGEGAGDLSGESVSLGGDVNGDGYDDILIGAYGNDEGGSMAGKTYLLSLNFEPEALNKPSVIFSKDGSYLDIEWNPKEYPDSIGDYKYTLYRSELGSHYEKLGTFSKYYTFYRDQDVKLGGEYHYYLTVETFKGFESQPSPILDVINEPDSDLDGIVNSIDNDDEGDAILDIYDPYPLIKDAMVWPKKDVNISFSSASFLGENDYDNAGISISGAGDVNGDGYNDLLIGAFHNNDGGNRAGKTYLIFGKPDGLERDTDLSNADASFIGEGPYDYSGVSVAGAGDINGDGYDDILIGAHGDDTEGPSSGKVYVIFGKKAGWTLDQDLSNSDASFKGEDSNDCAGKTVANAGDVNGDGYDDILIGSPKNSEAGLDSGKTYLIFGKPSGWTNNYDLSQADASFLGESAGDSSSSSLSGAFDVNDDGYDDFIIGSPCNSQEAYCSGKTYLFLGRISGWSIDVNISNSNASFLGDGVQDYSGMSISGAGDLNGDGYDDLLIGAHNNAEGGINAGQVYVVFGKTTGWSNDIDISDLDVSIIGESNSLRLGSSISGVGDINGDGYDDMIISSANYSIGGVQYGKIFAFLGSEDRWQKNMTSSLAEITIIGERGYDNLDRIAGLGDINGDNLDDFVIGSYNNDEAGTNSGKVE